MLDTKRFIVFLQNIRILNRTDSGLLHTPVQKVARNAQKNKKRPRH